MCIYYGHDSSLHYKNQEHVIPAGLGCSTKLAKGIVSDEANAFFSPIERDVLEKSLIQIPRIIQGPGKRGSLSPNKATTSAIVPIKCGKETMLGYMKGTKGYVVNQIGIQGNKIRFLCGRETGKYINYESEVNLIKEKMLHSDKNVLVRMPEDCNEILIAVFKKKLYIGCSHELKEEEYATIKKLLSGKTRIKKRQENKNMGSAIITIEHNLKNVYKIVVKTIINTFAYLTSEEDVLECTELTKLKSCIFSEDNTIFKRVDEIDFAVVDNLKKRLCLLNGEHACIITSENNIYSAILFFYNYGFHVKIGKCNEAIMSKISVDGIVVDWKKHIDYRYREKLSNQNIK